MNRPIKTVYQTLVGNLYTDLAKAEEEQKKCNQMLEEAKAYADEECTILLSWDELMANPKLVYKIECLTVPSSNWEFSDLFDEFKKWYKMVEWDCRFGAYVSICNRLKYTDPAEIERIRKWEEDFHKQ